MSLTIELAPTTERSLREHAAKQGLAEAELVRRLIESAFAQPTPTPTARELLSMPPAERSAFLAKAAEHAAPLYEADLMKPPSERELTALTALDGVEFCDDDQ